MEVETLNPKVRILHMVDEVSYVEVEILNTKVRILHMVDEVSYVKIENSDMESKTLDAKRRPSSVCATNTVRSKIYQHFWYIYVKFTQSMVCTQHP